MSPINKYFNAICHIVDWEWLKTDRGWERTTELKYTPKLQLLSLALFSLVMENQGLTFDYTNSF
jgi:hypothetical protein